MLVGMIPFPSAKSMGLVGGAARKHKKLTKLGSQAAVSSGRQGSQMLVRMARKAGLEVKAGGNHLIVYDAGGTQVAQIPHSLHSSHTGAQIALDILRNALF